MTRWLIALGLCAALSPALAVAQDDPRQIWDSGFRQKRPTATVPTATSPPSRPAPATTGDLAARPALPAAKPGTRVIGFTVWRLERARAGDTAPRLLVQDASDAAAAEYVPQRMEAGARLRIGDRVRLGIEVAHDGYLYVIDRERFADGTRGAPQLIFPARNLRGADNRIQPGRLVEIPGQTDRVPALRVQRADPRALGEELLVLVTAAPIPDLEISNRETPLSAARVLEWERRWARDATRLDLARTPGASQWTTAEQQAGASARLLTQDDPLPSSLYHVDAGGDGVLVRIPLLVE